MSRKYNHISIFEILIAVVLVLVSIQTIAGANECESVYFDYSENPTKENWRELIAYMDTGAGENCASVFSDAGEFQKLLRGIHDHNMQTIAVAINFLDFLDGGNYEDVVRELGSLTDTDASLFASLFIDINLEGSRFKSLLTMLPLTTVDDIDAKLYIVQERIRKMDQLTSDNGKILMLKEKAIVILKKRMMKLKNIKKRS